MVKSQFNRFTTKVVTLVVNPPPPFLENHSKGGGQHKDNKQAIKFTAVSYIFRGLMANLTLITFDISLFSIIIIIIIQHGQFILYTLYHNVTIIFLDPILLIQTHN